MCQNPDSTDVVFEEALPRICKALPTIICSGKVLQPGVINNHDLHISGYSTLQPTSGLPLASCYFSFWRWQGPCSLLLGILVLYTRYYEFVIRKRSRPVVQPPRNHKADPVVGFQAPVIFPVIWTHPLGSTIGLIV